VCQQGNDGRDDAVVALLNGLSNVSEQDSVVRPWYGETYFAINLYAEEKNDRVSQQENHWKKSAKLQKTFFVWT